MRSRIVALALIAATVALVLFGVPLAIGVGRYYTNDERTELERVADAVALAISSDTVHHESPQRLANSDDATTIATYRPDGTRVHGTGPAHLESDVLGIKTGQVVAADNARELVAAVAISDQGTVTGIVRTATTRNEVYQRTWLTWLAMLALAAIALAVTWLLARAQARKLAGPLEHLSTAARDLGNGDFTVSPTRAGIAEIDSVCESLESTARRLGDVLARERAFSAEASHQLRTPLTGLRLQLESGLDDSGTDLHDTAQAGIATTGRLERTIDGLLTLARGTRHDGERAEAGTELRAIATERRAVFDNTHRALHLTVDPAAAQCRVSAPVLRQILAVLLDNAARHGAGDVTVTAHELGGTLLVRVHDCGKGVAEHTDVFAADRPRGQGHGIGLALARRLAEAEGGRLTLSKPATFTLLLPGEFTAS